MNAVLLVEGQVGLDHLLDVTCEDVASQPKNREQLIEGAHDREPEAEVGAEGGSWSRGGGAAPDGLPCLWSMSAKLFACNEGLDCSGRKLLPAFLLVEMTTASKGVVSLLGASSWSYYLVARGSLGENPVQILDERRQSLLASCPSWRCRL